MDLKQKDHLVDEFFRVQPHLFGSFLVQKQFGVSLEKMDFLLNFMLVGFQAMKESGLTWPLITEADQDRHLARFVAITKFGEDLSNDLKDQSMRQYAEAHPEKELLAYLQMEMADWMTRIVPEESDKYVMMAAWNFVNCVAFVRIKAPKSGLRGRQKG